MRKAIRTVAVYEGCKGLIVITAGFGLLSLAHHDIQEVAEQIVRHLHLDPASHLPRIFLDYAGKINDGSLMVMAALAMLYSLARFIEAYGLWFDRSWGEWFAIIATGIYLPFEVLDFVKEKNGLAVLILVVNIAVLGIMVRALQQRKRQARTSNS